VDSLLSLPAAGLVSSLTKFHGNYGIAAFTWQIRLSALSSEVTGLATVETDIGPRLRRLLRRRGTGPGPRLGNRKVTVDIGVPGWHGRGICHPSRLKTRQPKRQPKLVCPFPIHLRGGYSIHQCALGELPVQDPDMRLDNLGQATDDYILHILGVEEAILAVTLRLNANPKGCGPLTIGLTHCDSAVVCGGHYGVGVILR